MFTRYFGYFISALLRTKFFIRIKGVSLKVLKVIQVQPFLTVTTRKYIDALTSLQFKFNFEIFSLAKG